MSSSGAWHPPGTVVPERVLDQLFRQHGVPILEPPRFQLTELPLADWDDAQVTKTLRESIGLDEENDTLFLDAKRAVARVLGPLNRAQLREIEAYMGQVFNAWSECLNTRGIELDPAEVQERMAELITESVMSIRRAVTLTAQA
jgi:hypothetical protein